MVPDRRAAPAAPTCSGCGQAARPMLRSPDRNRRVSEERFRYWRCRNCSIVFLDPVPKDLDRYYPADYYTLPDATARAAAAEAERYKIDIVRSVSQTGRLLEIGPGNGGFAWLAREAGYEVEVLERSEAVCRELRDALGLRAVQGEATPEMLAGMGLYEAVVLWHVIEHVTAPRRLFEAAAGALAPGGALVIATPNPRSLQFRLLRGRWPHLDAPRHVALIPVATLAGWGRAAGMVQTLLTLTDRGSLGWNQFGWSEWLVRLAPDGVRRNPDGLPARLLRRGGRELARVVGPVERSVQWGATYTAAFRRPGPAGLAGLTE